MTTSRRCREGWSPEAARTSVGCGRRLAVVKNLLKNGNSYCLLLDRSWLKAMGIDPEVDLAIQLTPYGEHLVLGRPNVIAPVPRAKQTNEMSALVNRLSALGIGEQEFTRLSADGCRRLRFLADANAGRVLNQLTVARLQRCERRLTDHEAVEDAVAAVLAEYPSSSDI